MFKLDLEKAQEPEIKLPTSTGSQKKQESSRKTSISALFDYAKAFDCVNHNKLWKIVKEMGIPDHVTCLLRNLYAGQEATVRTGQWTGWISLLSKAIVLLGIFLPKLKSYIQTKTYTCMPIAALFMIAKMWK